MTDDPYFTELHMTAENDPTSAEASLAQIDYRIQDTGDSEFNAMSLFEVVLLQLTPDQRRRVLSRTIDRFVGLIGSKD